MSCFTKGFVIATQGEMGMYVDFATEYGVENDVIEKLVIGSAGENPGSDGRESVQTRPEFMRLDGIEPEHAELRPVEGWEDDGAVTLKALDGEINVEGVGTLKPGSESPIPPGTTFTVGPWTIRYQLEPPE